MTTETGIPQEFLMPIIGLIALGIFAPFAILFIKNKICEDCYCHDPLESGGPLRECRVCGCRGRGPL